MEAISDYDLNIITYTPGKANVMADALSHKSYCCELDGAASSNHSCMKSFEKLNIEIGSSGLSEYPGH